MLVLAFAPTVVLAEPPDDDVLIQEEAYLYPSLIFDPAATIQGGGTPYTATVNASGVIAGTLRFISYRVPSYAATPNPSVNSGVYGMNIKVPVSWTPTGGETVTFSAEKVANSPILFHTPWGMDAQSTVAAANTIGTAGGVNSLKYLAMAEGWVLVEAGMRGTGTTTGTVGTPNFMHYGKLPEPLVDQKAALRYLRYETNAELIPGDKDRIFVTGYSSGGCSGSILGASGNNPLFDPYLRAIGAAPTSDDVYGVIIGCPIITRDWSDNGSYWLRFGDYLNDQAVPAYNKFQLSMFDTYQKDLGLYAMVNGESKYLSDYKTYGEYIWQYVEKSIIGYLNQMSVYGTNMALNGGVYGNFPGFPTGGTHTTGKAAIDLYLSTSKPADTLFGTPAVPRNWIKPVYGDPANPGIVTGLDNTFADYIRYYLAPNSSVINVSGPMTDNPFWYPGLLTSEGVLQSRSNSSAFSATSQSMGRATDFAAVFSDMGWRYLEEFCDPPIVVPQELRDLLTMQRNSVDPVYFTHGDGKDGSDTAPYWFIRNGAGDAACVLPLMFNLAESLRMRGIYTDVGVNWDRGHEFVSDVLAAWDFAKLAAGGALDAEPTPYPAAVLRVSTGAHHVQAGDYVSLDTGFVVPVSTNVVVLKYNFNGNLFDYASFTPADGTTLLKTEFGDGFATLTVMIPDYNAKALGALMLYAKADTLPTGIQSVSVSALYVLKDSQAKKTVESTAVAAASFTVIGAGGDGPEILGDTNYDGKLDLIDLSNMIDWFGIDSSDAGWNSIYIFFDFDNSGNIDIFDIAYVARLIGV